MFMLKGIIVKDTKNKTKIRFGHGTTAIINTNERFQPGEPILVSYDYTHMKVKSIITKKALDRKNDKEKERLESFKIEKTEDSEGPEGFLNPLPPIDFPEVPEGFLKPLSLEDIDTEVQWDSEGPVDTEGVIVDLTSK